MTIGYPQSCFNHKGIDNAVSQREIAIYLVENKYGIKEKYVNSIIRKLVNERKLPICSSNGKGYYWASTKSDIIHTINSLKGRCLELKEHIRILESFLFSD